MKKILCVVFCLFALGVEAQIGFEKGYFISNNGVKMECYIKNLDWKNSPVEFSYKLQLTDQEVKNEKIGNVKEFGIDNLSKYKRFNVKLERSSTIAGNLQNDRYPKWNTEIVFLKALVEGNANLYVYNDVNLVKFFFETETKPVEQLVSIRYMMNRVDISQYNPFRQQLLNDVRCDQTSNTQIENLKYETTDLVNHFVKYNNCFKKEVVNYDAKIVRKSFALKVTPSVFMTNLTIESPYPQYNVSTEIEKTVLKIGFEAEYILPFNKGKWSIFINPAYSTFKTTKEYMKNDGMSNDRKDINYIATVDHNTIEIPIGLRHYFLINPSSKIFLNAAYVFDVPMRSTIDFDNHENLLNGKRSIEFLNTTHLAFGVGYAYKKFSLEFRLNTNANLLKNFGSWTANYNSTGLVVGYDFL